MTTPEEALKKAEEISKKLSSIHVTVDDTAMKEMVQKTSALEEENEDLKNRLGLIAEKEIEKKLGQHPELTEEQRIEFSGNPEALRAYEQGKTQKENTGSAPINPDYISQFQKKTDSELDIMKKQFSSPEEMIMYLRKNKSAQNEAILKKLWEKAIDASVTQHLPMQYPPEDEKKEGKVPDRNFLNPDSIHEEQSEFERLGVQKKNPLWYSQRNKEEFEKMKKEAQKQRESK